MVSNSDLHGKRLAAARGAVSPRDRGQPEPFKKRTPPLDLASETFAHHVGLEGDDRDDEALHTAHQAFNALGRTLDEIYRREAAIRADGSKTEEAHALRVTELATKHIQTPAGSLDGARQRLNSEIEAIDRQVEQTFKDHLSEAERSEIRAHVRSLGDKERRKFLSEADDDVLAAVLSAKSFLSGLGSAEANQLRQTVTQRRFPQELRRRDKLTKAVAKIDDGWATYMRRVTALRDGRADEIAKRAAAADEATSSPINVGGGDE